MFNNKKLSEEELSYFCRQINMVVKAGLPVYYGISILRDNAVEKDAKELFSQIYEPMEGGCTLYKAINATGVFPNYMVQMIHIGETSGRLEEVLTALAVYYERLADIRSGIKHAVTYPIIMTVMMLAVIIVMITKVIPIFADVYEKLGSNLSGSAKTLMNISNFLNEYLLAFIIGFVIVMIILLIILKTPLGKKIYEGRGLSLTIASSHFANCMYLALSSGMDTDQGFALAHKLIENNYMKQKIDKCKELTSKGESFADAILSSGIFSKMYASLITIGYKTSTMDEVMLDISKAYENETDEKIASFISKLEPTLIIILSFFIGLILLSFLLPLLGIMSSIG